MTRRTVWITGSTGFIGSALVNRWKNQRPDLNLVLLVRQAPETLAPEIRYVEAVNDDFTFDELKRLSTECPPALVVHLATRFQNAYSSFDAELMIDANIRFPTRILEALKDQPGLSFINFGTYYSHVDPTLMDSPATFYASSKTAFESFLSFYSSSSSHRCITLKLFDTYGPGDRRPKLIPKWLEILRTREKMKLSPGAQKLNLVHVDDIIDAIEISEEMLSRSSVHGHHLYQLPASHHAENLPSLREVAKAFEKAVGENLPLEFGALPYRINEIMQPKLHFPILPGWTPKVSLETGFSNLPL